MSSYKTNKKTFAWALLDNRPGNRNQILGILSKLDCKYKIIKIEYNFFSIFPNFIFQIFNYNFHIKSISSKIRGSKPNIIISCGRRTAPVSISIKKKLNNKPLCIHLMYPRYTLFKDKLNSIITPLHDKVNESEHVKKFLGTPNNIKLIKKNNKKYSKPIFFLIIGGDHGQFKFPESEAENIILRIVTKLKQNNGILLITTSRRTSKKVISKINLLTKQYSIIKEVYHPLINKTKNTYLENLSVAKEIIVTGDSMSMISEACETKKPVRLYYNNIFCSDKHILFCNKLIKDKFAFPFESLGKKCKRIKVLNTSKKIASYIKNNLKNE